MVDDTTRITLKRSAPGREFGYVTTRSDQKREVLCSNNLSFPYREIDIIILSELRNTLKDEIERKIRNLEIKKKWLTALLQNVPNFPEERYGEPFDAYVNMNESVYLSLTNTGIRFIEVLTQLRGIRAEGDIAVVIIRFLRYLHDYDEHMDLLVTLLENPGAVIESTLIPTLTLSESAPVHLYQNSSDLLIISFQPRGLKMGFEEMNPNLNF